MGIDSSDSLELLKAVVALAAANIDGHVSEPERHLLVDISCTLDVPARRFHEIFQSGMAVSDCVKRDFNPLDSGGGKVGP